MIDFTGKEVEVITPDMSYKGVVAEIGGTEVHLMSESGWIVVPLEKIVNMELAE